jgi:hypothetical protein
VPINADLDGTADDTMVTLLASPSDQFVPLNVAHTKLVDGDFFGFSFS